MEEESKEHHPESFWRAGDDLVTGDDYLRELREKSILLCFLKSASLNLEPVQPAACFLLESFTIGVCCERPLTRIRKGKLVVHWSANRYEEEDAVVAAEKQRSGNSK
jgi:hypothetical protein